MRLIKNFPRFRQAYDYDCGASAVQSVLAYYGFNIPEGKVIKLAGTYPKGTPVEGIKKVAKKFGIKFKAGAINAALLKKCIKEGKPVIIALQAWSGKKVKNHKKQWAHGHYVTVIGYDSKRFYFADPYSLARTFLSFDELEKRWHDTDTDETIKLDHWGIIFYGKKAKYNPDKAVHMRV